MIQLSPELEVRKNDDKEEQRVKEFTFGDKTYIEELSQPTRVSNEDVINFLRGPDVK